MFLDTHSFYYALRYSKSYITVLWDLHQITQDKGPQILKHTTNPVLIDGSSGNSVCMMHATIEPLDSDARESINRSTVPCLCQIKPHYYHWLEILNLTSYLANCLKNFSLDLSALPRLFGDDQTLANFLIVIYATCLPVDMPSPYTLNLPLWGRRVHQEKVLSIYNNYKCTVCKGMTGLLDSNLNHMFALDKN
jgi:hypothetical protein